MTSRLKKNLLYGTLTIVGYFLTALSFTSQEFYVFGNWAGKSTVTITVFLSFSIFIGSLVMWCIKKK